VAMPESTGLRIEKHKGGCYMPKSILIIVGILIFSSVIYFISEDYYKLIFNGFIVLGILFKLREVYVLLRFYGHLFLIFMGFGIYSYFVKNDAVNFSVYFYDVTLSQEISMSILISVLLIYLYFLYASETKKYFSRKLTPDFISMHVNGNVVSCYLAIIALVAVTSKSLSKE
jgi:hypothetical protein